MVCKRGRVLGARLFKQKNNGMGEVMKKNTILNRNIWADGYALGIMSTAECVSGGTMNCSQCKYSPEYNPEHKSQLVCKNNMVKHGLEIINKIGSEEEA